MSLTVNTLTYENDTARSADSYRYHGPVHTLTLKDYIDLKRTAPKPNGTSEGKARAQFKLTRTMTDGTDPIDDGIANFDIAIPVGSASAEIAALLLDGATWLTTAAALTLVEDRKINQ